jgi:hypothetical protein
MSFSSWLQSASISDADVRGEIWRLGGRHFGAPLEGALEELKADNIPPRQAGLLKACVRKLQEQ